MPRAQYFKYIAALYYILATGEERRGEERRGEERRGEERRGEERRGEERGIYLCPRVAGSDILCSKFPKKVLPYSIFGYRKHSLVLSTVTIGSQSRS
jgi:hypothetical protein